MNKSGRILILLLFVSSFSCQKTTKSVEKDEMVLVNGIAIQVDELKIDEFILPYSEIVNIDESFVFGLGLESISIIEKEGDRQLLICGLRGSTNVIIKVETNREYQIEEVLFEEELNYTNISDIEFSSSQEVIITGNEGFSGKSKITKMSNSGSIIWENKYGGDNRFIATAIDLLNDDELILVGREVNENTLTSQILVFKINKEGEVSNEVRLSNGLSDLGYGVEEMRGHIFVLGISEKDKNEKIVTLFKLTSDLELVEVVELLEATGDMPNCKMISCEDGGVLIISEKGFDKKGLDIVLTKVDSYGNINWSHSYGSEEMDRTTSIKDEFHFIKETNDGGFLVGGEAFSINRISQESIIFHVDKDGELKWNVVLGNPEFDIVRAGVSINEELFYVVGASKGLNRSSEFQAIKFVVDNNGIIN